MKKTPGVILSLAVMAGLIFFGGATLLYSVEKGKASAEKRERLEIAHTEVFGKLQRPKVIFDHGLHSAAYKKEGCKTCHPSSAEGGFVFEFPFRVKDNSRQAFIDAYHGKCIGCHVKRSDQNMKSGPVRCGECHSRRFETLAVVYPAFDFDFAYHDKHVRRLREDKGRDDCGACHHTYDAEEADESLRLVYEEGTEESCYYCHDFEKKRGPALAAATRAAARKGLSMRRVSHDQCVNCHMDYISAGRKAGPVECLKCHTGKYRSTSELLNVPRPDRAQPERPFIDTEDGKMRGVQFDHAFHEKNARTCRSCHHETLRPCGECHGMVGSAEGGWINLANAYHELSSESSCAGCHRKLKSANRCAGCHYYISDVDPRSKGPQKKSCAVCHSGRTKSTAGGELISASSLKAEKVPERVTIKALEDQYQPSAFPHMKIIERLAGISNDSKLATAFHRTGRTFCRGCHHQSEKEAEVREADPPQCRSCHSVIFDPRNMNRPRLLAAYHRQCITCHEKMDIRAKGCSDCHKKKMPQPKALLSEPGGPQARTLER